MNVFLPYPNNIPESVALLDDARLRKQILECQTIMKAALGESQGYAKHCVTVHYSSQTNFLLYYALACCNEYFYRFGHSHKTEEYFISLDDSLLIGDAKHYIPLYAEKSKSDPHCLRITNPIIVGNLFKEKLFKKWINDKRTPKWTKRESGYDILAKEISKGDHYEQF